MSPIGIWVILSLGLAYYYWMGYTYTTVRINTLHNVLVNICLQSSPCSSFILLKFSPLSDATFGVPMLLCQWDYRQTSKLLPAFAWNLERVVFLNQKTFHVEDATRTQHSALALIRHSVISDLLQRWPQIRRAGVDSGSILRFSFRSGIINLWKSDPGCGLT